MNDADATLIADENETDLEGAYAERRNGLPPSNKNCVKLKQLNSPDLNISLNIEDIARRRENEENGSLFYYIFENKRRKIHIIPYYKINFISCFRKPFCG